MRARVARHEVEAKARAEVGESIGGSNASSDADIGIVGVENKVSDSGITCGLI